MDNFTLEQRYVAEAFQTGMAKYQQEPLLLYGFGRNTEGILRLTIGYSIVGLLGPTRTEGELYGKRILSLNEAAALSKIIVIVASEASRPIIFRRIKEFAQEQGIMIYDFNGNQMQESKDSYDKSALDYWNHSWNELKQEIIQHDVISFDIFDTLLGRYVLRPRDVFALMEEDIRGKQGLEVPFEKLRTETEHDCEYGATIFDIYEAIHQQGVSEDNCKLWLFQELAWESKLTYPKTKVVEIFQYALSHGKEVYLTSDMYLPRAELKEILSNHEITGYNELLVSCEEKAQKSDGTLFAKLKQRVPGKSILHIGDNRFTDIEAAKRMGLDAYHLWSGYDLFMVSSLSGLLVDRMPALGDRLALGLLCAKLFADPFSLNATKGKVTLTTPEQMGFCFVGPWALGFMQWASERVEEFRVEQFIYPARDGFLFWRIAQIMQQYGYMKDVGQIYLKASRRALSVANIRSMKDLEMVLARQRYRGTNGEMLQELFRIEASQDDKYRTREAASIEESLQYLNKFEQQILSEAEWERKNYQAYLAAKDVLNQKKAAVFDFVAAGTVQYYLERHLDKRLIGLYCGVIGHPNEMFPNPGHVFSAFGNSEVYGSQKVIFRIMEMMETLLVDGDNRLEYINESGKPVFRDGQHPYEQSLMVQQYACQFASQFLSLFGKHTITLTGAEKVLSAMFRRSCAVEKPILDIFASYDEAISGENIFTAID